LDRAACPPDELRRCRRRDSRGCAAFCRSRIQLQRDLAFGGAHRGAEPVQLALHVARDARFALELVRHYLRCYPGNRRHVVSISTTLTDQPLAGAAISLPVITKSS
jgi:hypothetical protein